MSNSRLDGVRKGTRIPDLLLRRQSLYPTELYGPIVLKPAISRGLTPYIVFLGLDNILSEEGIIDSLLLSIYCRVGSHFSRRFELTTELPFFSRLVLALFLRRRTLYPTEVQRRVLKMAYFQGFLPLGLRLTCIIITQRVFKIQRFEISKTRCIRTTNLIWKNHLARD